MYVQDVEMVSHSKKQVAPSAAEEKPAPEEKIKPQEQISPVEKDSVLDALRPAPLPQGLATLDRTKVQEWDKKLKSLDPSAPNLSELFEVLVSQQATLDGHAQVLAAVIKNMESVTPQINAISNAITESKKQIAQQPQQAAAQGAPAAASQYSDLLPIIMKAIEGNQQPANPNNELTQLFIQMGKEAMQQNQAIGKAIVQKITGEAAQKVVQAATAP